MTARALMLQGTGSDVGKSVLVAGLCRAARNRGLSVAPFKPQNMSNNAAVAAIPGSDAMGEIGRAQWLQALAARVDPTVDMNPVLIKPHSDTGAQLVVHGRVAGQAGARDYQSLKARLMPAVLDSWQRLKAEHDILIVEGAGSPAEVNLRQRDIANMGFAIAADVPVVLVGDIDRGGVIAALAGTHLVLSPEDRAMIAGYIVNKFRGDLSLFDDGITAIGRFTGWPCFGVVPWLREVALLPAEDAVVLERDAARSANRLVVAVPMLSRIANFDDLDPLRAEPGLDVVFVPPGRRLPDEARLVVIPGSKATIADLAFIRAQGWDHDIHRLHACGATVVGLCGGYQMLGRRVTDPSGAEAGEREAEGLGLLDVETELEREKTVRLATGRSVAGDLPVAGYEIHLGVTQGADCARPLLMIEGRADGATSADGRVTGTYLHGLFTSDAYRRAFLEGLGVVAGLETWESQVDAALDSIAGRLEEHLDCDALFALAR